MVRLSHFTSCFSCTICTFLHRFEAVPGAVDLSRVIQDEIRGHFADQEMAPPTSEEVGFLLKQARSVTSRNGGLNFATHRDTPTTSSQIVRLYCTHTRTLYLTYLPNTVYIRTYLYMGKKQPHAYLKC